MINFKKIIPFILLCYVGAIGIANSQNVYIPDSNFKSFLLGNTALNTDGDTAISYAEAAAYTDTISHNNSPGFWPIYDITGIEAFTNLKAFISYHDPIANLDFSANTALTYLVIDHDNGIANIDISANTALQTLAIGNTNLTQLDVSANTALTYLSCAYSPINSLDIGNNTALLGLDVRLDLSSNGIDLHNNINLTKLSCFICNLVSLDVSHNTALTELRCNGNNLTNLDLSSNTALTKLDCSYNFLTNLNLRNGNNVNFILFDAQANANLTCIQVDNAAYSTQNWTPANAGINDWMYFSENCTTGLYEPSSDFSSYPNPTKGIISLSDIMASVSIKDNLGRLLLYKSGAQKENIIDIENFPDGIYWMTISNDKQSTTHKVLKFN